MLMFLLLFEQSELLLERRHQVPQSRLDFGLPQFQTPVGLFLRQTEQKNQPKLIEKQS